MANTNYNGGSGGLIGTVTTLVMGASTVIDASTANNFVATVTTAGTYNFTTPIKGSEFQGVVVRLQNNGKGSDWTPTWDAAFQFGTWTKPTIADGFTVYVVMAFRGTGYDVLSVSQSFAN